MSEAAQSFYQQMQKSFYDLHSFVRKFNTGDKVLALQPSSANKLFAENLGPYTVVKRVGTANNAIDTGRRIVMLHVNTLWSMK